MKTIMNETIIEFEEKKSKFIGYIKPVNTVLDAEFFIKKIRENHKDASHNVPLYRVIENGQEYFKYNDDGEPSNTAGKPMAEILTILDVYNLVMVATRYFGGIKLGAGGLIRNYAKTAKLAINEAGIVEYIKKRVLVIDFDYKSQNEIENFLTKNNVNIIEKNFFDRVALKIEINEELEEELREIRDITVIEI